MISYRKAFRDPITRKNYVLLQYNPEKDIMQASYHGAPIYQIKGDNNWEEIKSFFKKRIYNKQLPADIRFYLENKEGKLNDITSDFQ